MLFQMRGQLKRHGS